MNFKREDWVAFVIMVICLAIGIIGYAAFSLKKPELPIRIMFTTTAGNVLFDHKIHSKEYADCTDCHHDISDETERPTACGECHLSKESEEAPKRAVAFHKQCIGCHEDQGAGPTECSGCHVR